MDEKQIDDVSETVSAGLRPVLIVSRYTISEYVISLKHLLVGLADESVQAVLVCPPDANVEDIMVPGLEVIRHPVFDVPFMGWQNRKILAERLLKFGPTVLHCLCESEATLVQLLTKELNIPYVLTVNSLQKGWGQLSISLNRCAKIIAPTRSIAASIEKIYPKFAERIAVVNVGTFARNCSNCFSDTSRLASIVTSGPVRDGREFRSLFGAVKHLVVDGYEFMLVVIAGRQSDKQLRMILREYGLLNIVVSVPRQVPWRPVLAAGDIFVQAQPSDFFNPLLLEAMSVGATVACCKGGVDDLMIDGQNCIVFDPDNELSIYDSLKRLFDNHQQAQQLAQRAQQYLRENYKASTMVSQTLQTYRQAQDWYKNIEAVYSSRP
jgi:glycosyltransferase involved in cell wall biosynthesis